MLGLVATDLLGRSSSDCYGFPLEGRSV
jgi:hypothetical protein